ncbi:MAG TPA: hypothetical protein VHO69_19245, partial [Phototrophicaceae bacterium]|nr:hypothetical protein [Phototrophicaceae bacterium]
PRGSGYLYIAVLGARPNVLPALADSAAGKLYLTAEHSLYGPFGGGILQPDQVRLFDGSGRPLSADWLPWAETLALPKGLDDKVYILSTDGKTEVLSAVDLAVDVVVLPGYEPPPDPAQLLVPPMTPTPTLTPEPPKPELLLVYDNRSLAVINQSRRALNLYDLELVGAGMRLPMTWWLKSLGLSPDFQLYAFPAGDCALAWSFTEATTPRPPAECRVMRAGRSQLTPSQLFWLEGSFEVWLDGQVVGTCQAAARRCEVELPG